MSESVYDLFKKVREHPDYVFGTIFTKDDFRSPDEEREARESQKYAEEALAAAGNEWIENS